MQNDVTIGATGTLTQGGWVEDGLVTVNFGPGITIENAVVVVTGTNNGGDPYTLRVHNVTETSFQIEVDEYEYLDGNHSATETINWVAVAEGTHILADGRVIQAGTTSADESSGSATFAEEFTDRNTGTPVVITSVMSKNDPKAVDSDPLNITSSGFDVRLQQEEAQRAGSGGTAHLGETVGWIAFETGAGDPEDSGIATRSGGHDEVAEVFGFGATFSSAPIVVADAQTINGADTSRTILTNSSAVTTTGVNLTLDEETSRDSETGHINEDVGIVAFAAGAITGTSVCYTPGAMIATPTGPRAVESLREGDLVITADQGLQPIRWIGAREITGARLHTLQTERPVLIRRGALWPGCPAQDITVSQQHRVLMKGAAVALHWGVGEVLVPAKALIGLPGIERVERLEATRYIHLLLDQHAILTANGMETESFHPAMDRLEGLDERDRARLLALLPDLHVGAYGATARRCLRVGEAQALRVVA
ncbi:MAG: Hint domain-containing protein [Pseudomonadota bacterium]